jgi:glycerophosphoryl diester phosphodiesterase
MPHLALPPVIGHRGAAGHAPENTLAGFRHAARLGVAWVEFDVQLTADAVPVVIHDHTLDRTTDGYGQVRRCSFERLRRFDAGGWMHPAYIGERVPTLAEVLAVVIEAGQGCNIELKPQKGREAETARVALETARALWPAHLPPPLVSSFEAAALGAAREAAPDWPRGFLAGKLPPDWRRHVAALDCASVNLHHRRLTPGIVAEIREAGLPVAAYTVNDPARACLLWSWGVSSVFSDVPDAVMASTAK